MYTTAPLRTNQKYVYKRLKLHVHKIRRNARKSDLYPFVYQRLTNTVLKGALLHCKRASLTPQKSIFYFTKNHMLSPIYESLLQPSYALFPFIISEYLSLYITRTTPLKRLFFNFPVIPYLCYNTLITSRLYEMLKVTATKNKKYFGI